MFVFLPLLPTRELSHTSPCIPQESCFGIFLVTFPSPGCPHMSLALGKKLLTNDAHHNTFLSFSPLKEGLVASLHICIFPDFTSLKRDSLGSCWWAPHVHTCSGALEHPTLTFSLSTGFAFQDGSHPPSLGAQCTRWGLYLWLSGMIFTSPASLYSWGSGSLDM